MSDITMTTEVSAELIASYGCDLDIAAAAWVSTQGDAAMRAAEEGQERVNGLIRSLMRHKHGTPFEDGFLRFLVRVPLFIRSEHHRHRIGWSYSEISGRYTELKPEFYVPARDRPVVPASPFHPMSPEFQPHVLYNGWEMMVRQIRTSCEASYQAYQELLEQGIAKEIARLVLPLSWMTTYIARCNPRSLMHFLSLRTHDPEANHPSYPQWEIDQIARQMEAAFAERWPMTHAAWIEYGREAP